MFKSSGIRTAAVVSVLGLIVAAAVAYLVLPPRQTSDIPMPASNATPEQVVLAYLDALNAHDCDTAEALMVERARDSARMWCQDVASLTNVDVTEGGLRGTSAGMSVTFTLNWRPFQSDGSMNEGPTTWGYRLVRDSADSPWRIFDQGAG